VESGRVRLGDDNPGRCSAAVLRRLEEDGQEVTVPKGVFVAITNPVSAEREEEYTNWYEKTHMHEVLGIEGFVSVKRFKAVDGESPKFMAVYEVDVDDLSSVIPLLGQAGSQGNLTQSDASDRAATTMRVYELVAEAEAAK
jgi:hypothetical protein